MGFDLLVTGVGGQGVLFFSDILAQTMFNLGWCVKKTETHGMSQRGGSVAAHIRVGENKGILIPPSCADFLVSLEPLEALRHIQYVSEEGKIIVCKKKVDAKGYPPLNDVIDELRGYGALIVDPTDSKEITSPNMFLLGALSCQLPLDVKSLEFEIREKKPSHAKQNIRNLRLGALY